MSADLQRINNTLGKMEYHLATHNSPCVMVSGGSDSNVIVHMIATNFRQYLPKTHFLFCNTGLEYRATLRHLDYMEERYKIKIDRVRGVSVVTAVREYGVPILSKEFSQDADKLRRGNESIKKKMLRKREEKRFAYSPPQKALMEYIMNAGIRISDKCCDISKKKPATEYKRKTHTDLAISGERQCEGGQRAVRHADCFESGKNGHADKYMPLFFWDDETKQYYKEKEQIRYSDCYEIWGMKRTGCVGCPFNSRVGQDLKMLKLYEPNLYKACLNVFGESYRLMDQFGVHRQRIFPDENQFKLWEDEE